MARRFGSATAFKASLETHLRKLASERKVPLSTLQLKFVIERLLARLFRDPVPPWLLKGGFAMDLRFRPHARTTKDVDLGMSLVSAEPAADFSGALRDRISESAFGLASASIFPSEATRNGVRLACVTCYEMLRSSKPLARRADPTSRIVAEGPLRLA